MTGTRTHNPGSWLIPPDTEYSYGIRDFAFQALRLIPSYAGRS